MIPSLEGLPTKAKEAPSPHEVRLSPLDTNPVFHSLVGSFNPDLNKEAQEVIFSRKMTKSSHLQTSFINVPVSHASFQKHLGNYLDEKLNFNHHINKKMTKAMKGIGVIERYTRCVLNILFLQYINHWYGLMLTMVIYFMIKQ